jgi:hypothetical protein
MPTSSYAYFQFGPAERAGTAREADVWSWLVLEIVVHNHTPLSIADGYRVVYGLMTKVYNVMQEETDAPRENLCCQRESPSLSHEE